MADRNARPGIGRKMGQEDDSQGALHFPATIFLPNTPADLWQPGRRVPSSSPNLSGHIDCDPAPGHDLRVDNQFEFVRLHKTFDGS